jgi:hypothetical protein
MRAEIAAGLDALGFAGRYTVVEVDDSSCRFEIDDKAQCITAHRPFARTLPNAVFQFPGMIVTTFGNASFRQDDPNMGAIVRRALQRFADGYGRKKYAIDRRLSAKVDALVRQACAQGGNELGVSEADTDQRLREELKAMIDGSDVWNQRRLARVRTRG